MSNNNCPQRRFITRGNGLASYVRFSFVRWDCHMALINHIWHNGNPPSSLSETTPHARYLTERRTGLNVTPCAGTLGTVRPLSWLGARSTHVHDLGCEIVLHTFHLFPNFHKSACQLEEKQNIVKTCFTTMCQTVVANTVLVPQRLT